MANQVGKAYPAQVRKRDGSLVAFDKVRIENAIRKALEISGEGDTVQTPQRIAKAVAAKLSDLPAIEHIQDLVEEELVLHDLPKSAKAYILYCFERAQVRERANAVPEHVRQLAAESRAYFPNSLAEFIYYRTYSRWIDAENRRETWVETVARYMAYMKSKLGDRLADTDYVAVKEAILRLQVMPSMRLLWSAGAAAEATNVAAYNCAFVAPTSLDDFAEIMYLLMCGTGVGFSVEHACVEKLPLIAYQTGRKQSTHRIGDTREGWCDALKLGLLTWFSGGDIDFDYTAIRPAGARLQTMGGRSSGPGPLKALLEFCRARVLGSQGRRLHPIDVHDIVCKIGEVVVMGGVRRSALISLSDLDDPEMREAKFGAFYQRHPERALANNSVVYNAKPSATTFLEEWLGLAKSGTGERGIFNRGCLAAQLPARRWPVFESGAALSGTNPCGEIILQSKQFCNLSEVVARPEDTLETLLEKIRLATLLGTYQATLTDFPYLSRAWRDHGESERLLGVSITGHWDAPLLRDPVVLARLRDHAVAVNKRYAVPFGIRPATAVTCVKPSGTVSLMVDAASGLHPRYARYYLRRVRIAATDPLFNMLREQKFPYYPEVGQHEGQASTYVLEFPVKAPDGAVVKDDLNALAQLEHWKQVKAFYTEHNPSVTVYVSASEWIAVANWVYENWADIGGLAFLPRAQEAYALAPYEEISAETYHNLLAKMPAIDFGRILLYEKDDQTVGAKTLACLGDNCELDPEEGSGPR